MTLHPKGPVDGLHGLPIVDGKTVRVFVDGDMPRGVQSWNAEEGWADVLIWNDDGTPLFDGENYVTQRVTGRVEVKPA